MLYSADREIENVIMNEKSLRTPSTDTAYQHIKAKRINEGYNGCPLCEEVTLQEFEHWRLVANEYPYDRIAEIHHMLIPKAHVDQVGVSSLAWQEYAALKETFISENYGYILETTHKNKSVPRHFHVHLIVVKEEV